MENWGIVEESLLHVKKHVLFSKHSIFCISKSISWPSKSLTSLCVLAYYETQSLGRFKFRAVYFENISSDLQLLNNHLLKLIKFLFFSSNDRPSKIMKNVFFISSKKLFLFSRYSNFCIFLFLSFSPCQSLL